MPKYKFKKISIKFSQSILLLVFFILITTLLLMQGNLMVNQQIENYKEKQKQEIALRDRIANLDKLQKDYQEISNDVEYINQLLPNQDEAINIISRIEAMAKDNKVDLSTKFESEISGHKITARFTVSGYTENVMSFINNLSNHRNILVTIKAIKISDSGNIKDNVKAEILTEVYFD